jgi:hypothetical protein
MAILLNDNINIETGKHLDNKYGPYADIATAKSSIPVFKRARGLTVGIIDSGFLVEYWFKDGTTDSDLVLKAADNSTSTNVQSNSANWNTAYAYVSSNSVNLTATNIFVNNDLTVTGTVSAKYFQGTLIDWMTLVRGYKTTPTLLATIGTGEVYTYVYATTGTDKTYYRYIATNGSEDSFYGNFTNPTLSNLITTKKIIL